jgi:hypothetical protein
MDIEFAGVSSRAGDIISAFEIPGSEVLPGVLIRGTDLYLHKHLFLFQFFFPPGFMHC